jgi:hypothetical protein
MGQRQPRVTADELFEMPCVCLSVFDNQAELYQIKESLSHKKRLAVETT